MNRICPLCAGTAFSPHRFGFLRCVGCGMIVDLAVFRPGAAEQLNEEAFGDTYEPERSFWVRWFNSWKNRRYLGCLRRAGVTGGELLEVGVGSGSFLRAAQAAGFSVSGCDLSHHVCRRVEQATGIPMHCGSLETLPSGRWDVVVMNHVLEHVYDPVGFLRAARERLRPGGVVHVAVPNGACWEARLPGWNYYLKYHLLYFTPGTLGRGLQQAGFSPLSTVTHENFSGWFLTMLRTLASVQPSGDQRIAASIGRVPRWWPLVEHPYRLVMVTSGALAWPLRAVQGQLGRGDELIIVARW